MHDLERLAQLAGISTRYRDAWGEPRETPPENLRALLGAMGVAVASPHETAESLARLEDAPWRMLAEPAVVFTDGAGPPAVELSLDTAEGEGRILWSMETERGETRQGSAAAAGLAILAAREVEGVRLTRRPLPLGPALPVGYHRLTVETVRRRAELVLIVAPPSCYLAPALAGSARAWALTTQLYALRSERDGGIGDFTDLAVLGAGIAARGARALGVNPLHALFPAEPRHISPYSPSSRRFLNDLYIDVAAMPDLPGARVIADPALAATPAGARAAEFVDYPAVAAAKRALFEKAFAAFRSRHLTRDGGGRTARGRAFRQFQDEGGAALAEFALFQALHEDALRRGLPFSWREWPAAFRDPRSPEVRAFAGRQRTRIEGFQYLQWEADRQLGAAAHQAQAAGLSIGLYRDLAVGVDASGAEAWADQELLVPGASVGAPPDLLNLKGQNWGLAPISPIALKRRGYAPFIAAVRSNMRHAGALRIDHVMALKQLYWVPRGGDPAGGAYIAYPFHDLLRILALESHRHRCTVIGEDLGTVPEGFREDMRRANVLSYRVLVFERRGDGAFIPPEEYPRLAAASVGTHDIATLKGYWLGRDLAWRRRLDLYPNVAARDNDLALRARDRRLLLDALVRAGVLDPRLVPVLLPSDDAPLYSLELGEAVHRYVAQSASCLMLVQIEDAIGEAEQPNLPGTLDEHPNWRRRLPVPVEEILRDPVFARLAEALNEARREAAAARQARAGAP